jgi:hypothetical protein
MDKSTPVSQSWRDTFSVCAAVGTQTCS